MIFGRTDLRIDVSGAKFHAGSDFEVHLAVAFQKPGQNSAKQRPTDFSIQKRHAGHYLNFLPFIKSIARASKFTTSSIKIIK